MTPQEAIKIFKTVVVYAPKKYENKYYKAIMLAEEALEKQIRKNHFKNECGCIVDYKMLYKAIDNKC
ncbi:MAG: hypothetical protein SOW78_02595, partial [Clostridia bacterium]|nr:hypothetical protein [Clostridia bacterium]